MPTVGERLASLELLSARNRELIDELRDDIHGGRSVEWKRSVRGRLHDMQSAIDAADKLADATRELVREQSRLRKSRIKLWQWLVATAIAAAFAAAPYVALFAH